MKEKILIALGDKVLANILVQNLKQAGYQPSLADNGNDALEKMKLLKPDLLLLGISVSGKTSYDVLNEKSFDREITKIPVIIISNSGVPIQMRQIPSTPVIKDYIVKTHIEPSEVIEKIEKAFGRGQANPTEATPESPAKKTNGKKVLWVEDDKLLSNILTKKFDTTGYTLLKASRGEEAFKFLQTETPDIIILDIVLPEMSGLDILQKIKMEEKFRKIPVIMLSNISKQGDFEKAKLLGANKYIVKAAVSLDQIIREIENLLK